MTERRAAAAPTGQIVIQCTPWCVPFVDKQPRGKDGRTFTLALPAGAHRVEAHRLEDRQGRDVQVRAGAEQVLKLTFD